MSELLEYDGRKLNNLPRGDISNMLDLAAAKLVAKGYNPFQIAQILNYHGGFITQDHDVFMVGILSSLQDYDNPIAFINVTDGMESNETLKNIFQQITGKPMSSEDVFREFYMFAKSKPFTFGISINIKT